MLCPFTLVAKKNHSCPAPGQNTPVSHEEQACPILVPGAHLEQGHLEQVAQGHVSQGLEHLQGQRLHNFSGQCGLDFDHLLSEKKWFSYAYTISCKCLLPLVLWLGATEKRPSPQLPPSGEMYPLTHMSKTPLSLLFSRLRSPTSLSFSSFHRISPYRVELPQMAHKHHISFTPIGILAGSLTKGNISPVISAVPYGTVVPPQACCSCI